MASVVAEFFQIIGVDMMSPENIAELIPYLLQIGVGIALVSAVFGVLGKLADIILNFTRWR